MRILLYTHEYLPARGGAGIYTYELAKELSGLGASVAVLAPAYNDHRGVQRDGGVTVRRMATWETAPPWCYRSLLKAFIRHRPSIVLVTDAGAQDAVARMPRRFFRYGVVVYGTELWTFLDQRKSPFSPEERELFERFYLSADALLAISNPTAELLAGYLPEARPLISTIGAGVDPACFPPPAPGEVGALKQRLAIRSENVVLCLARMGADKGQDTLVRAFRRVVEEVPGTVLLLVGEGPTRKDVEQLAKRVGVFEQTRFLGAVTDEERRACYELCDVFVMASRCQERWEGFGLVFLEANCYGKPVVGGASGGVPDAIEDGVSGLLVDPMDEGRIADAVIRLLRDPGLRRKLGSQGRERVLGRFTSREVAARALWVLETRLAEGRPCRAAARKIRHIACLGYWWAFAGLAVIAGTLRLLLPGFVRRLTRRAVPARLRQRLGRVVWRVPGEQGHEHNAPRR